MMEQRMSVITLGVDDFTAMKSFYSEVIGWKPVAENTDIVFYRLNGFLLSLCPRQSLADFIGIAPQGSGFRAVTFGYNVETEAEVQQWYNRLKDRVTMLSPPASPPFGGLFFYFADPEGNVLEIACNTYVVLNGQRNVIGHHPIHHL